MASFLWVRQFRFWLQAVRLLFKSTWMISMTATIFHPSICKNDVKKDFIPPQLRRRRSLS